MEVTFENFNEFIHNHPNKSLSCEHRLLNGNRLDAEDFVQIGILGDKSFGYLSYLWFQTNDEKEIFLGSYPYNGATVWLCTKCNRITLTTSNDSGWGQLSELKIDFDKEYIVEPANKFVEIKKSSIKTFVEKFGFESLLNSNLIGSDYSGIKIIDKTSKYVFGYRERGDEFAQFEVIAPRILLRQIAEFEKSQK